jgi:hypothetical protein
VHGWGSFLQGLKPNSANVRAWELKLPPPKEKRDIASLKAADAWGEFNGKMRPSAWTRLKRRPYN